MFTIGETDDDHQIVMQMNHKGTHKGQDRFAEGD